MTVLLRGGLFLPICAPSPSYNSTKNFHSSVSLQCDHLFLSPYKRAISTSCIFHIFDCHLWYVQKDERMRFSPIPNLALSPSHPTRRKKRRMKGREGGREEEQTICDGFSQMEGWASNARVRLNQRRDLQAPKEGQRQACKQGRCSHCCSKCGVELPCFPKACFLSVLTFCKEAAFRLCKPLTLEGNCTRSI